MRPPSFSHLAQALVLLATVSTCAPGASVRAAPTRANCPLPALPASPVATSGRSLMWIAAAHLGALTDADNGSVVIFQTGRDAAVVRRITTQAGPAQILFDVLGRLLVVERAAATVSAYDPCDGRLLARGAVPADPLAFAIGPDASALYVISAWTHTLSVLDVATLRVRASHRLARDPRGVAIDARGRRLYVTHLAGQPLTVVLLARGEVAQMFQPPLRLPPIVAEDVVLAPGGDDRHVERIGRLDQPVSQAWSAEVDPVGRVVLPLMINRPAQGMYRNDFGFRRPGEASGYGAAGEHTADRVRPMVFGLVVWDPSTARWSLGWPGSRFDENNASASPVVPMATAVDPARNTLYVVSTGNALVLAVEASTDGVVLTPRPTLPHPTAATPGDDELLVYSQFEHSLEYGAPSERRRLVTGVDPLPPMVATGRQLFHRVTRTGSADAELACASCHPDGLDDGLTWTLRGEWLQTPTLRGRRVAPFLWDGSRQTLLDAVSEELRRIGGHARDAAGAEAIAAYVTTLNAPPSDGRELSPQERQGRSLFEGAAMCAGCHRPDANLADGRAWPLAGGPPIRTPSLRGVGRTAPYFHDGRYVTLRDLLRSETHGMGRAARLSDEERAAIEAWLMTL